MRDRGEKSGLVRTAGAVRRAAIPALLLATLVASSARAQSVCPGVAPVPGTNLVGFVAVTGVSRPLLVTAPPGDTTRLFIVSQDGLIMIHRRGDPAGTVSIFLDITDRVGTAPGSELGLLGLAFDSDYQNNGLFYVDYTSGSQATVVARFERDTANPDLGNAASETVLLVFAQPEPNHNGGQLMFGLDRFLYVATGDGGGAGDQHASCGNGQLRATLLGKILRLDVDGVDPQSVVADCGGAGAGYRIPSTNPFALTGNADCGEIWIFGVRNPWRNAIDPQTGDLYVADVGQNCWEEVDVLPLSVQPGANLGWRSMEGSHCFDPNNQSNCNPIAVHCFGVPSCGAPSLLMPTLEYGHGEGCAITGGPLYRGCQMPDLAGTYLYGDLCSGFVRSFRVSGGAVVEAQDRTAQVDPSGVLAGALSSFGTDGQGEMYAVSLGGTVLRLAPPLSDMQVSGTGATPFLLGPGNWTWEDLSFVTMQPVARYRIYRGQPNGTFHCIANAPTPSWPGDPAVPSPGGLFAFAVTAVSPDGVESRPGIAGGAFLLDACN
jgi:glucose/arabinose dehydrogenase